MYTPIRLSLSLKTSLRHAYTDCTYMCNLLAIVKIKYRRIFKHILKANDNRYIKRCLYASGATSKVVLGKVVPWKSALIRICLTGSESEGGVEYSTIIWGGFPLLISASPLILQQCTMKTSPKMTGVSNFCGKLWRISQMVRQLLSWICIEN